jgi:hypothetical protein
MPIMKFSCSSDRSFRTTLAGRSLRRPLGSDDGHPTHDAGTPWVNRFSRRLHRMSMKGTKDEKIPRAFRLCCAGPERHSTTD